jgi:hypothetical protein
MPDCRQVLYQKLTIKKLMTYASEHIDEWNKMYGDYIISEWKRLYTNEEYDDSKILMLTNNPDFMPPFWGELSNTNIPRIRYMQDKEREYLLSELSDEDIDSKKLDFQIELSKNREKIYRDIYQDLEKGNINYEFKNIDLRGAYLWHISLENAKYNNAKLQGATFRGAKLSNAQFNRTNLEGADFINAQCKYAVFTRCNLKKARFEEVRVDKYTRFFKNEIDRETDFSGVGLSDCRMSPETKTALENNIRRKSWMEWYDKDKLHLWYNKLLGIDAFPGEIGKSDENNYWKFVKFIENIFINVPVRIFWSISNYGSSTLRIILWFLLWNFGWFCIYCGILFTGSGFYEGTGSFLNGIFNVSSITNILIESYLVGFYPDILGNSSGNLLWSFFTLVHVGWCYVIIAALVTRLSIMFQSLSP